LRPRDEDPDSIVNLSTIGKFPNTSAPCSIAARLQIFPC
jgi:hypothetical protein